MSTSSPSLQHRILTHVIPVVRHRSEVRDPERVRREVLARQAKEDPGPPRRVTRDLDVRQTGAAGLRLFELRPRGTDPVRTVVYVHGGGHVSGLTGFHWRYAARLVRRLGVRVVLPDYPLAPTHTWQDALPPLVEVFEQLAIESPQGVVLMGDSSGGGLAVGVAQLVARRPGPQPTHLVAFAPWVDLTGETPGTAEVASSDPWLTLSKLKLYGTWWGAGDPPDPRGSPLAGDLSGMPPTLLLCGTRDLLLPMTRALAAGLEEAGSPVTYVEQPGLMHVYPLLPIPEARLAWDQVRAFL